MNSLQQLSELDLADRRRKYPSAPLHSITPRRFTDGTANALTQAILRWLELHGCYAVRINTTGRQLPTRTYVDVLGHTRAIPGQWIKGSTRKGTADNHAVINGRHVSIEVKIGRDRMSEQQRHTAEDVRRAGGIYITVGTFQQFYEWYQQLTQATP